MLPNDAHLPAGLRRRFWVCRLCGELHSRLVCANDENQCVNLKGDDRGPWDPDNHLCIVKERMAIRMELGIKPEN